MIRPLSTGAAALLLAASLALPARAGEVVIVHGGGGGEDLESALREALSAFGVQVAGDDVVDVDVIQPPYPDELVVYGATTQARCGGKARSWDEMRAEIARGQEVLDALEYADAEVMLGRVWEDLACADAFVDAGTLIELSMLLGLSAHYRGQRNPARQWFSYALAVNPDLPWNDTYPPEAQQVFNHALAELLRAGDASLDVGPVSVGFEVRIDGTTVDPLAPRVTLKQGTHLVQWRGADGAVVGTSVFVGGGDQAVLLSADGLGDAILDGPATPGTLPAALDRLAVLAESRGAAQVVVLGDPTTYRWTAATGEVEEAPLQTASVPGAPPSAPNRGAGPALIGVGGGTALAGAVMVIATYARGSDLRAEIEGGTLTPEQEAEQTATYDQMMDLNTAGFVIAGAGAAVLVTGIVIAATGGNATADAGQRPPIAVGLTPLPGGAWGQFSIRF